MNNVRLLQLGIFLVSMVFRIPVAQAAVAEFTAEPIIVRPNSVATGSQNHDLRQKAMNAEFDCIRQKRQQSDVSWSDVCVTKNIHLAAASSTVEQPAPWERSATPHRPSSEVKSTDQYIGSDYDRDVMNRTQSPSGIYQDNIFSKQHFEERKTHSLDVNEETFYYLYREPGPDVKLWGIMNGYSANYTYRPPDESILNNPVLNTYGLEARWAEGDLDYKGSGKTKDEPNDYYEYRGLFGKDYLLRDQSILNWYFGFGYRHLDDIANGRLTTTGYYGYDRHSSYYYIPVGLNAILPQRPWHTELNVEVDFMFKGKQVSDLSNGNQFNGFNNPDIENDQTRGVGVRGSIKLAYKAKYVDLFAEPFIRYWNIDDSEVTSAVVDGSLGNFYEPENKTFELGSKFGIAF